jgi:hypothetical protein
LRESNGENDETRRFYIQGTELTPWVIYIPIFLENAYTSMCIFCISKRRDTRYCDNDRGSAPWNRAKKTLPPFRRERNNLSAVRSYEFQYLNYNLLLRLNALTYISADL